MSSIKPRVRVPRSASVGEVITIKTLISHPMESGQRKDKKTGETIPRQIIHRFVATFGGEEIVSVDMDPAVSSNPYFEFRMKVPGPGSFVFRWFDDDGSVYEMTKEMTVA